MWHINRNLYLLYFDFLDAYTCQIIVKWLNYIFVQFTIYSFGSFYIYILTLFPRRKTSCTSFIYTIAPSNTFSTAAALRITTIKQFKPLINMRKHRILHLIYSSMYKERSHLKISLSLCYIIKIMWHFHTKKNHSITKQKYNPDLMHAHAHKNRPYITKN